MGVRTTPHFINTLLFLFGLLVNAYLSKHCADLELPNLDGRPFCLSSPDQFHHFHSKPHPVASDCKRGESTEDFKSSIVSFLTATFISLSPIQSIAPWEYFSAGYFRACLAQKKSAFLFWDLIMLERQQYYVSHGQCASLFVNF